MQPPSGPSVFKVYGEFHSTYDPDCIDPLYLDEMIEDINNNLLCPASQCKFVDPVITVACGHVFNEESIRNWYEKSNKSTCMTCRAVAPEYYRDQAVGVIADNCLSQLKSIRDHLLESRKTNKPVDLSELLWFCAINQKVFSLFQCGHTSTANMLRQHLQSNNLDASSNVDLSKRNFVCRHPDCKKSAYTAVPHRTLRNISEILHKALEKFQKAQAVPKNKRPDTRPFLADARKVRVSFDVFEPMKPVEAPKELNENERLLEIVDQIERNLEDNAFENVETYLDFQICGSKEAKKNIGIIFARRINLLIQNGDFSENAVQCLELALRYDLYGDSHFALHRARIFKLFLDFGVHHIHYLTKITPTKLLDKMFNVSDRDIKYVVDQLIHSFEELDLERISEARMNNILNFLMYHFHLIEENKFQVFFKLVERSLKRNGELGANLHFEKLFFTCLNNINAQRVEEGFQVNYINIIICYTDRFLSRVLRDQLFVGSLTEVDHLNQYFYITHSLLVARQTPYQACGIRMLEAIPGIRTYHDENIPQASSSWGNRSMRSAHSFHPHFLDFVKKAFQIASDNHLKIDPNAVLQILTYFYEDAKISHGQKFLESIINALRVADFERNGEPFFKMMVLILTGVDAVAFSVYKDNKQGANSMHYFNLCKGIQFHLTKWSQALSKDQSMELLNRHIHLMVQKPKTLFPSLNASPVKTSENGSDQVKSNQS